MEKMVDWCPKELSSLSQNLSFFYTKDGGSKVLVLVRVQRGCVHFFLSYSLSQASLVAQTVKNLPEMWETQVRSLGWEDPLQKQMAIHSSIIAQRNPWTEKPGKLPSMEFKESDRTEQLHFYFLTGGPGLDVSCELNKGIFHLTFITWETRLPIWII